MQMDDDAGGFDDNDNDFDDDDQVQLLGRHAFQVLE